MILQKQQSMNLVLFALMGATLLVSCGGGGGGGGAAPVGKEPQIIETTFTTKPLPLLPVDENIDPTSATSIFSTDVSLRHWTVDSTGQGQLQASTKRGPWYVPQANLTPTQVQLLQALPEESKKEWIKIPESISQVFSNFVLTQQMVITCDQEQAKARVANANDPKDQVITVVDQQGQVVSMIIDDCKNPTEGSSFQMEQGKSLGFALQDPNRYVSELTAQSAAQSVIPYLERSYQVAREFTAFGKASIKPIPLFINGNMRNGVVYRTPSGKEILSSYVFSSDNAFFSYNGQTNPSTLIAILASAQLPNTGNLGQLIENEAVPLWMLPFVAAHEYGHYVISKLRLGSLHTKRHHLLPTEHHNCHREYHTTIPLKMDSIIQDRSADVFKTKTSLASLSNRAKAKLEQVQFKMKTKDQAALLKAQSSELEELFKAIGKIMGRVYQGAFSEGLADSFANLSLGTNFSLVSSGLCSILGTTRDLNASALNSGKPKEWSSYTLNNFAKQDPTFIDNIFNDASPKVTGNGFSPCGPDYVNKYTLGSIQSYVLHQLNGAYFNDIQTGTVGPLKGLPSFNGISLPMMEITYRWSEKLNELINQNVALMQINKYGEENLIRVLTAGTEAEQNKLLFKVQSSLMKSHYEVMALTPLIAFSTQLPLKALNEESQSCQTIKQFWKDSGFFNPEQKNKLIAGFCLPAAEFEARLADQSPEALKLYQEKLTDHLSQILTVVLEKSIE